MELDIYNNTERKIRCISNTKCYGTVDDYKLEVGKIYTLAGINVCSWHTEVYVYEIPGVFNSCSFEEIED